MSKLKDLTGMKFGRLTVVERAGCSKWGGVRWMCKCDCGKEIIAQSGNLLNSITGSCGCLSRNVASKTHTTHGECRTRLYDIWSGIKKRTNNPNNKGYRYYGGRGIKVCDEWKNDYVAFRDWAMANGYDDSLSIDRIDNDGNYEPSNCRWADKVVQCSNRRSNRFFSVNGERRTLAEWSRYAGINVKVVWGRINLGWSIERALGMVA